MNFKGWEKVEDDGKTAKLRHEKGHEMVIAIKSLPRLQQEAIKRLKMAKGGKVEDESYQGTLVRWAKNERNVHKDEGSAKLHEKFAKDEAKGRAEQEREVKPDLKGLADGGEVRKEKGFWESEHGKQAIAAQNKEVENIRQRGDNVKAGKPNPKVKYYADGSLDEVQGADDSQGQAGPPDQSQPSAAAPITINVGAPQQPQVPQQAQAIAPSQSPPVTPDQPVMPQANVVNPRGDGNEQEAQKTLNANAQAQAAIQGKAAIEAAQAQAVAPAESEKVKSDQDVAKFQADAYNDIKKHADDYNQFVASHPIDNERWLHNRSTGSKIANGIGLFLGGLGSASGGHNFAMDFMQKQIDRDVLAQQQDINNKHSVFGAYQQLYGDSNVAANLAKASSLDILNHKIQLAAAQLGTPQSQYNAAMANQDLSKTSDELRQKSVSILGSRYQGGGGGGAAPAQGSKGAPTASPGLGRAPQSQLAPPIPGQPLTADQKAAGYSMDADGGVRGAGSGSAPAGNYESPKVSTILAPGAMGALAKMRQNTFKYPPEVMSKMYDEYQGAAQAENALQTIREEFAKMAEERNGLSGYIHRNINPHVIAGLGAGVGGLGGLLVGAPVKGAEFGAGIGEVGGQAIKNMTNSPKNKDYDTHQGALTGAVASALAKTNIGSDQIREIVQAIRPDGWDGKSDLDERFNSLVEKVRTATPHSYLESAGLWKKK